jgi:hypothetical protein
MIAVGVDTHKHWHVAVALDALGGLLCSVGWRVGGVRLVREGAAGGGMTRG